MGQRNLRSEGPSAPSSSPSYSARWIGNRIGGTGVVGHAAIAEAPPDGHTIGMLTLEIAMMHWTGLTPLTPRSYTPLALMNQDAAGVLVNAAAPWADLGALAEALRAAPPRRLKGTGSGRGGSWHLAFVGWLRAMGLCAEHVLWVPVDGAGPALRRSGHQLRRLRRGLRRPVVLQPGVPPPLRRDAVRGEATAGARPGRIGRSARP